MNPPLAAGATFRHGPQRPRRVPLLPGLDVGRSYYDYHSHRGSPKRYRSDGPDTLAISDGPDLFNQVLMGDGAWYLHAGDRPALRLAHRPYWPNSYIKPDLIPGLGISGDLYFAALTDAGEVPLHLRTRVQARFSPGQAEWVCTVPGPAEPGPPGPAAPVDAGHPRPHHRLGDTHRGRHTPGSRCRAGGAATGRHVDCRRRCGGPTTARNLRGRRLRRHGPPPSAVAGAAADLHQRLRPAAGGEHRSGRAPRPRRRSGDRHATRAHPATTTARHGIPGSGPSWFPPYPGRGRHHCRCRRRGRPAVRHPRRC